MGSCLQTPSSSQLSGHCSGHNTLLFSVDTELSSQDIAYIPDSAAKMAIGISDFAGGGSTIHASFLFHVRFLRKIMRFDGQNRVTLRCQAAYERIQNKNTKVKYIPSRNRYI